MRAFIVMCLVAVACADKLGYNYQPVGHSNQGLSFAPGSGSISGGSSLGGLGGGLDSGLSGGSIGGGSGLGGLGGLGSIGNGGLSGGSIDAPVSYNAPAPAAELEKEFFTFTANEQDFDEPQSLDKVSSSLNKGLRVVFIKGPENRGLENAALALAKQAAQQETAIYVLNKQADIGDLANKLNSIRSNTNNKPEVHFVKYRTPEDAANAQRAIQGQYDQLGGSSKALDGGVAPALNFASQGPVRQVSAQSPDNSYLPTSVFRRLRR
ncbi:pupal cuticle protein 36a-like [Drosophila montana]|uniref:pupal cuticle protein 36a-like n=1 Tax=Drosophila montana TaxID=40370 RepID=UPI00313CF54E